MVESCLPAEILRAWERYVGYSSDESGKKDLDSLMKFLSIEVSSEDRIKLARNSFDSEKFNYKKKLGNLSTTATAADLFNSNFKNRKDFKFKNSNDNCIFCEKMHASENCCEAASMLYDVKKNAVIKRGVCYICLKRGHMSHSCRSDVKCIICNKRHYAVLCSKLPLRSGLETESASVENSTTASSSSSNVLANQACTSEVLLQTLVVVLQNGNHKSLSNILLNPGKFSELENQPDNFETMVLGLIWNLKDDCLSCKINCQKIEGRASLYYEELNTVLCECEHVINSRPLTYISEDVNDLSPLIPAMFLQEIETSDVTDIDCLDHQEINKRIRHVQTIREQLRKRFRIEYLGQLREQTQRQRKSRPLTVGEVVVVENSLNNRTMWSLARVIQLIPGKDGHIRVARVKTETGELVRPVQRLYNLELQEPEINLPKNLTDSVIRTRRGRKVTTPKRLTYA
ncbi:integrase catalytic domain-containing protein [Trichonephila inaurata madagascariensis]|uniref:Integrase catalytic domain-containing protein n=1 Tax=Trichonephila inaurata madagascariensis TaxID=2747483 RepID=A0A8X6XX93_9ARAC|nr:integrase catalytic domain-containing protein [Trichonephila inaurata madagascariensis]GFY60733.1 integrase catalytic domain-containing protein [Trichonephila inaurata madagascariensis]